MARVTKPLTNTEVEGLDQEIRHILYLMEKAFIC